VADLAARNPNLVRTAPRPPTPLFTVKP